MTNRVQAALELRKALQFFLETLDVDTQLEKMLEIPSVYPVYTVGKEYKVKDIFSYGENSVGDPQLYQVLQQHTSAKEWVPNAEPALYKAIGLTKDGYPEWVQPLGAADAYNKGDVVSYNNVAYESLIDGNVWVPDGYSDFWKAV